MYEPYHPTLANSADLTQEQREKLWRGIRKTNPALANQIKAAADAARTAGKKPAPITLPLREYHRYVVAGTEPTVSTLNLSDAEREQLFAGMRRLNPDYLNWLTTDPNILALQQHFGCGFELSLAEYQRYLAAGKNQ